MKANITTAPVDKSVQDSVRSHLHGLLDDFGLERIVIEPGEDYEGDPLINIDAYFRLSKKPVDLDATWKARAGLFRRLRDLGEDRFPYLRLHFNEKQKVTGDAR